MTNKGVCACVPSKALLQTKQKCCCRGAALCEVSSYNNCDRSTATSSINQTNDRPSYQAPGASPRKVAERDHCRLTGLRSEAGHRRFAGVPQALSPVRDAH